MTAVTERNVVRVYLVVLVTRCHRSFTCQHWSFLLTCCSEESTQRGRRASLSRVSARFASPTLTNVDIDYLLDHFQLLLYHKAARCATGRVLDLQSTGCVFKFYSGRSCVTTLSKLFTPIYASVTKQYNLVPAKGRSWFAAGKVAACLAESNGSLPPNGWLIVTCGLTACSLHRDQLRAQRSVTSMGSLYLYLYHMLLLSLNK